MTTKYVVNSMHRLLLTIIIFLCGFSTYVCSEAHAFPAAKTTQELYDQWRSLYSHRCDYTNRRQKTLDSMSVALRDQTVDSVIADNAYLLGTAYLRTNIDSAYHYFSQAEKVSKDIGLIQLNTLSRAQKIAIKPYRNILSEAVAEFESINPEIFTNKRARIEFFRCAHRLYNLVEINTPIDTLRKRCSRLRAMAIDSVVNNTPRDTAIHNMMNGMRYFDDGRYKLSIASFLMALDSCTTTMPERSRILLALSVANQSDGNDNEAMRYALEAAIHQIKNGDRLGGAWLQLDELFLNENKIIDAYDALEVAMENATNSKNTIATLRASEHYYDINTSYARYYLHRKELILWLICGILFLVAIDTAIILAGAWSRRHGRCHMSGHITDADLSVSGANGCETSERYTNSISQLVNLFAVYMDKIDDFQMMARRRINSGQTAELLTYLQSGKVVNEQAELFSEIFDTAFLSIYPDFVSEINALLRPDKQIVTDSPLRLSNEVRIFAFMRLGIDDASRIARFLNVSVNTIYTYRNRMRQRAINRDTFEDDLIGRTNEEEQPDATAKDYPKDHSDN